MSNQDVEIIAGAVGAPPIMRTSVAVAEWDVEVCWSTPFTVGKKIMGLSLCKVVRVRNVDAILNYIKSALQPMVGAPMRAMVVNPILPPGVHLFPVMPIAYFVTEATFKHVMQMLGIDFVTNLEPGASASAYRRY